MDMALGLVCYGGHDLAQEHAWDKDIPTWSEFRFEDGMMTSASSMVMGDGDLMMPWPWLEIGI